MITPEESKTLDSVATKSSEPVKKNGSEFLAISARVNTVAEVKNFYSKVLISPYAASVDNRILVYIDSLLKTAPRMKITMTFMNTGWDADFCDT